MANISSLISSNVKCIDILGLLFDFNSLESLLYFHILQNGQRTVVQLISEIERNQSTIHTALQKLVSQGLIIKSKYGKKPKGYEFRYTALEPNKAKELLHSRIDLICNKLKNCVDTFDTESLKCNYKA